jgi:hypothetical protein
MFEILKDWHFQKLTEKTLEIAKGNQSFSSTYFEDPEKVEKLSNYCRDFFKRDIEVRIVGSSQPFSQKEPLNGTEKGRSKAKLQSHFPAPVQDILHMFQGELIGIEHTNRSKKNQEEA